jgi:D-glycero-D-manno-heptose 1,7-bisphosphate phosphatase
MLMKNKAIFLDRDGIINQERGDYTYKMADFVFVEDLVKSLRTFQKNGFRLIVISNQSGISKGIYSFAEVEELHAHVIRYMRLNGIEIDELYYCPHHPDKGLCICRKPDSQLIEKALARFQIDRSQSWFIGDRQRDVDAGEKAGVRGVLVDSNSSLLALAQKIVQTHTNDTTHV